jgi:hypothetical protein
MNTRFSTIVGLAAGLLVGVTATVQAQFSYQIHDGMVTITGYTGPGGDVLVPDTIDGLTHSPAPATVRVQRSANLVDWEDWQTVSRDEGPSELQDAEAGSTPYRFYRLREQ